MARIEWVSSRLAIWGAWKARREDAGLGFARVNILLSLGGGGQGGYRESSVPINELEAAETDRAVESLKLVKSHLYLTLQYIYVRNTGIRLAAQRMQRAESTIKAQLEQADAEIARWFEARREQAEAKRSFTP
ncbi:MAG: hypothetical protein RLZZ555_255 [Pseudomonadota bacterium]|jgi:hypothetical protein